MPPERKQITLRVSPSQKEDWDSYAEELNYNSRGEMIRRAVEYYYAVETEEEKGGSDSVEDRLQDVQESIESLRLGMEDVRREQLSQGDIDDVAGEVEYRLESLLIAHDEEERGYTH